MADITLSGGLGRDAELKFTPSGSAVLNFSVADDNRRQNPQTKEWETVSTTWWPVTLWGKQAENLAEHLTKGTRVVVVGSVHERKFEHNGEQRSSFDVKARTVAVIPRSGGSSSPAPADDPWGVQ